MSKEFTKSYAINRIAELNEQIVEMTDNQNQTMRYLNRIRDENKQLKQQLEEKDKLNERLKITKNNAVECAYLFKVALGVRQKELVITELEKMKIQLYDKIKIMNNEEHCYSQKVISWFVICDLINNQIKELKK